LIPFPSLDGSYPFLLLLEKKYGKEKGLKIVRKMIKYGFIFLMILQFYLVAVLLLFWNDIIFLLSKTNWF
jgi:membrane-associated protease RseP (regulator of RpoE activity)